MGKKKRYRKQKTSLARRSKAGTWQPTIDRRRELNAAVGYHKKGNLQKAASLYQEIINDDPNHPDALHLLGVLLSRQGDYEGAVKLIQKAIQNFPANEILYNNLANALSHAGRFKEALDAYRKALKINPGYFDAYNNMGNTVKRMGKPLEAIGHFQKALTIRPGSAEVYSNMGNILAEIGRVDEALKCYTEALKLNPNYAKAYNNMGSALKAQERYAEAIDFYCKAVETDPQYAEAFNNLGATITDIGKPDEAIKFFQKAFELKPDFDLAQVNLYYALKRTCDWHQLDSLYAKLDVQTAKALEQSVRPLEDPFLNLARHADPALNCAVAKSWSNSISKSMSEIKTDFTFDERKKENNKITVGYLSNNFRNHAMAHLMAGMFKLHDRSCFNIYAYSTGEDDKSDYRKRIQKGTDKFIDIRSLNHLDAARTIYEDKVDILIDLMGYTRGGRIEIVALRPAPVQVRYMGMAGTTGSAFFDYLIADQIVIPEEHTRYYSEKLVYLPACYQINDDQQKIADLAFNRKGQGLPEDGFVFCSFNQAFKLDPIMFKVWMDILKAVPESVMWLQAGSKVAEENLAKEAEKLGVPAKRIVFGPKMIKAQHLARLGLADLALDTRMVSGAATTSDALWAGIPVITLQGKHFSSRMSSSILNAMGLPELVAPSLEAYEKLAVRLATSREERQVIKKQLLTNRRQGPLFDTSRFTCNIEMAYKMMLERFRTGKKPDIIRVT